MDKLFGRIKINKILILFLTLLGVIQLYQPDGNKSIRKENTDFLTVLNAPKDIEKIIKNSCYNCHSNNTNYQWYDKVAPVSWWIDTTIKKAKTSLNFSEWNHMEDWQKLSILSATEYDIKTNRMPPKPYLFMHRTHYLTEKDKQLVFNWIQSIDRTKLKSSITATH